jgi:hypothetical protein
MRVLDEGWEEIAPLLWLRADGLLWVESAASGRLYPLVGVRSDAEVARIVLEALWAQHEAWEEWIDPAEPITAGLREEVARG